MMTNKKELDSSNDSLIDGVLNKNNELNKKQTQKNEEESFDFFGLSYRLLAKKIPFLFPRLISLQNQIEKSGTAIHYEAFVCGIVFASILSGIVGIVIGIIFSVTVTLNPPILEFVMPLILGSLLGQVTFAFMYYLPRIKIKSRESRLTGELPYYIGYMATLASSGLDLQGVFRAISWEDSESELVLDAKRVMRNLDMLGMDLSESLKDLIKRSPSDQYTELLEGLSTNVKSGGDLKEYFASFAKVQLEEKKIMIKKSTAALGMVSELYTILLIVFPLLASIILSVMGIMTPNLGGFDLSVLMRLLTFIFVPFLGIMMMFMMDAMVPRR